MKTKSNCINCGIANQVGQTTARTCGHTYKIGGDSIKVMRSLFQEKKGGAIPTSPLQLELRVIEKKLAEECFRRWHYLGSTKFLSRYNFGVFTDGQLWGCISFGSPNATELSGYFTRDKQDGWWEIKRFALSDTLPKNSESRVIAIGIRILRRITKVVGIITYADSGVGHEGIIYKASGFEYKGLTAQKKDYFVGGKIQQRGITKGRGGKWVDRSRKHLFIKIFTTH